MNSIYDKKRLTPAQMKAILYRRALMLAIKRGAHFTTKYPKPLAGLGRKKKKCGCKKQKGRGGLSGITNHHMSLGDMKFTPFY